MKKMLTNNLTLKLLSVVAAIMLWLVVMNIDDPYTYRDFSPVQVTMLNENVVTDQGKVYKIEDGSDVISLRVWGKKSILRDLNIEDFTATADMQKSIKYNDLVGIEVSCSNKNIRTADINMSRENVVISVEDAASEQFNVVVKQNGKVADGYMIGAALPEQSLIQINGPASVIAKIKRVEVEIKTTGVNSDRTIHGKLNVLNSDGEAVDTTYLEYTGKTDGHGCDHHHAPYQNRVPDHRTYGHTGGRLQPGNHFLQAGDGEDSGIFGKDQPGNSHCNSG